ncbi:hypothetical protein Tco_0886054 [Tanacetum coccineum]
MLEGKLVLVGYDGLPLKPMNDDGQTTVMDHFPWLSDTFGTPNTTTKVVMADTGDTSSNNREDVANLRTLIALARNGVDVTVSLDSVLEDKERYENSVYRSSFARAMIDLHTDVELKDTLVMVVPKIEDMASSSGIKIVTSNPFDVLNMVDKDIRDAPSDTVNSKADDVNVGNIKVISWIMRTLIAIMTGGTRRKSIYDHSIGVYDDNPYDNDVGHEDITEEQLAFFDAFDISLRGQNRFVYLLCKLYRLCDGLRCENPLTSYGMRIALVKNTTFLFNSSGHQWGDKPWME